MRKSRRVAAFMSAVMLAAVTCLGLAGCGNGHREDPNMNLTPDEIKAAAIEEAKAEGRGSNVDDAEVPESSQVDVVEPAADPSPDAGVPIGQSRGEQYCPHCGVKAADTATYCSYCGMQLPK